MFARSSEPSTMAGSLSLWLGLICLSSVFPAPSIAAEKPGGVRFSKLCLMVNPNEGCVVADLNGDTRPDIAVAGKTGTWLLWDVGPR